MVLVADVYAAGETPIEGVSRDALVAGLRAHGHRSARPLAEPRELAPLLRAEARPGDMVVCLGAGSITNWANALPEELAQLDCPGPGRVMLRRGARNALFPPSGERVGVRGRAGGSAAAPSPSHRFGAGPLPLPRCGRGAWQATFKQVRSMPGGGLIELLPPVRGRLTPDAPIGPLTWFRVGGPAEVLFRPADSVDLAEFLAALPRDVPVATIGVGSNLLVRDGGIGGVVVRLGRGFAAINATPEVVEAGAGALDLNVALTAAEAGVAGLEFLSGIPGTIGGGFRTNAGAYGSEFKDVLISADIIDRGGVRRTIPADRMGLSYRHSEVDADWIFVLARFRGRPGEPAAIARHIEDIRAAREASQPIRARTGGSTFANPPGHQAWRLIDEAGCRGLTRGGAMISEKHTNFLINTGNATAADLEGLGEEVRRIVYDQRGIMLEWEIRRIGEPAPGKSQGRSAGMG